MCELAIWAHQKSVVKKKEKCKESWLTTATTGLCFCCFFFFSSLFCFAFPHRFFTTLFFYPAFSSFEQIQLFETRPPSFQVLVQAHLFIHAVCASQSHLFFIFVYHCVQSLTRKCSVHTVELLLLCKSCLSLTLSVTLSFSFDSHAIR